MKRVLEELLLALDAIREAPEAEKRQRTRELEARLEAVIGQHPNVSREALLHALRGEYAKYVRAQQKPPTMPPRA